MCLDTGGWASDTFRVYDMDDFVQWIRLWPEVDFEINTDDTVRMYPAWDLDYAPSLPVYRYDDQTGDGAIGETRYEDVFLAELAWRVAVGETCVLKIAATSFGDVHGYAIAIAGGEEPPQDRIVSLSLNDIYGKAADELRQGRLMLTYMAAE